MRFMRIPTSPPQSDLQNIALVLSQNPGLITYASTLVDGQYLHWDELQYKQPLPPGLDHARWWALIKLARQNQYKRFSLLNKNREPFQYLIFDKLHEQLHDTDLGAGGRIEMPGQITPDNRDRYVISSLIEEAITSSQLEGAVSTRQVAQEMIRSGRPPVDVNERMILNNFVTMRRLRDLKNEPLTKEMVFHIHELMTNQTLKDPSGTGRFRRADESIRVADVYGNVYFTPPAADQLEARMDAMCDFADGKSPRQFIHPVVRSILLHFWLAHDHPFIDGNGRSARALFYWSMLHHGYWLFEYVSISRMIIRARQQYYRAFLYAETDDNDLTYFIAYHLDLIEKAKSELHEYIQKKTMQDKMLRVKLSGLTTLNHRQRALVGHALRHPGFHYTIKSHGISHNVVHQTARTDLMDLERRGLLYSEKVGRTFHFIPVAGLEAKIAQLA